MPSKHRLKGANHAAFGVHHFSAYIHLTFLVSRSVAWYRSENRRAYSTIPEFHLLHVMDTRGTKLIYLQIFSQLLIGYEKVMSPCIAGDKGGVVVLDRISLAPQISIFLALPEGRLVTLNTAHGGIYYMLVGIYAFQNRSTQNGLF